MGCGCGASREGVIKEAIELGERVAEAEQRVVEELDEIHASVEEEGSSKGRAGLGCVAVSWPARTQAEHLLKQDHARLARMACAVETMLALSRGNLEPRPRASA